MLQVATCQFPVGSDIQKNADWVRRQIRTAADRGADVVHFGEGALSGYAGTDFASFEGFDWEQLAARSREIAELAKELGIWVLLGSSHRLSVGHKPHNSVYVIDDRGRVVDRYDKRFCAGDRSGASLDLAHYSPGDYASVFTVRGIRCGVLICHDYRYPELYRDYVRQGVQLVFHSFHAGNIPPDRLRSMQEQVGVDHQRLNRGSTLPEITMPATMQAAAAAGHVSISCSNTSARESCWPAFFVRADGVITGRLVRNRAGVLMSAVDPRQKLYDSTAAWRMRAIRGVLHSGRKVRDVRSGRRTGF
jgi:predicted amidohydrolase